MLPDLVIDLLIAKVELNAKSRSFQRRRRLASISRCVFRYGCDDHLDRSKPHRESAGEVFDQNSQKPLERPQHRTMEHDRTVLHPVLADILSPETLRQHEVELKRSALPCPANGVLQMKLQFRAVKSPLSGEELQDLSCRLSSPAQHALSSIPRVVCPRPDIRTQGKFDRMKFDAEILID